MIKYIFNFLLVNFTNLHFYRLRKKNVHTLMRCMNGDSDRIPCGLLQGTLQ